MAKFDAELKGFEKLEGFEFEDGGFETAQNLAKVARKVLHKRYLGKLFAVAADGSELDFDRYGESIKLRHHWGCIKVYVNDKKVYEREVD